MKASVVYRKPLGQRKTEQDGNMVLTLSPCDDRPYSLEEIIDESLCQSVTGKG